MGGGSGGSGSGGRSGGGGSTNGDAGQPGEVVRQATLEKLRSGEWADGRARALQNELEQKADHASFMGDTAKKTQLLAEANAVQSARDQAWKEKSAKININWNKVTTKQGSSVRDDTASSGRVSRDKDFLDMMKRYRSP